MTRYDFPQDLSDAQLALHQTQFEYEQYATTLPWSAEPMPGWEGDKQLHSAFRSSKPDSPGYCRSQSPHSVGRGERWKAVERTGWGPLRLRRA
ncbi:hypothetical protein [Streptomyces sp. NPDC007346]|uniref:hypothetical protein n=1 Tax=Streptomyces sp. NPDC007346 TaxID=3154682 RepID=UPI003451230B